MMFRNLGRHAKRLKGQEPSRLIAVVRRFQSRQEVRAGRAAMTRMRQVYETLPAEFFKEFQLAMESQREVASRDASRMIFLVHAGALVALASLLGSMHSSSPSVASGVLWSGSAFLTGLVLVVVSSMLSAKSSYLYSLGFLDIWIGEANSKSYLRGGIVASLSEFLLAVSVVAMVVGGVLSGNLLWELREGARATDPLVAANNEAIANHTEVGKPPAQSSRLPASQ